MSDSKSAAASRRGIAGLDLVSLVRDAFRDVDFKWWVCGGVSLSLHLGYGWRRHDDLDIAVEAGYMAAAHEVLTAAGFERIAQEADSRPQAVLAECMFRYSRRVDVLHIMERECPCGVGNGDAGEADLYKTSDGIVYLAPVVVLVGKARRMDSKDQVDAERVIRRLTPSERTSLLGALPEEHAWRSLVR